MDTGGGSVTRAREAAPRSVTRLVERARHRQPGDAHRVAGGLLLVAWLAWLVVTALMQPRLVSDTQFREDVASGDVVAWRAVETRTGDDRSWVEDLDLWWVRLGADGRPVDTDQPGAVTIAYATSSVPSTRVVETVTDTVPSEHLALLGSAEVPEATTWTGAPRTELPTWADWSGFVVGSLFFGLLLIGPRPVHGTRWFWFWFAFPTLGLGVVLYAVVEHLRRPRGLPAELRGTALDVVDTPPWPDGPTTSDAPAAAPTEGAVGTNRRSGLAGLLTSLVLGFVTLAVLSTLVGTTGWVWLIRP